MELLECKSCGGKVIPLLDNKELGKCESCGFINTLPNGKNEKIINLYNRANNERMHMHFDKAIGIYDAILNEDSTESDAYFGIVLCTYGVEYVNDNNELVITCHRTSRTSVFDDSNYLSAIEYADESKKEYYIKEAKKLDKVQKEIIKISNKEKPYDIFISFKDIDENGERTIDSVKAHDIYNLLTKDGYRVFYSRISLEEHLGENYEPYIYSALTTSKVMIVVASNKKNIESPWVKNEWTRFLKMTIDDSNKLLIPVYVNIDPYELPTELQVQGIDINKIGFKHDLLHVVSKVCKKKDDKKELYSNLNKTLERANNLLEDMEFDRAKTFFEKVLDEDPNCAPAYLGNILCDNKCVSLNGLTSERIINIITDKCIEKKEYSLETTKEDIFDCIEEHLGKNYIRYCKNASDNSLISMKNTIEKLAKHSYELYIEKTKEYNENEERIRKENELYALRLEEEEIKKELERKVEEEKRKKYELELEKKRKKEKKIDNLIASIGIIYLIGIVLLFVLNPYFRGLIATLYSFKESTIGLIIPQLGLLLCAFFSIFNAIISIRISEEENKKIFHICSTIFVGLIFFLPFVIAIFVTEWKVLHLIAGLLLYGVITAIITFIYYWIMKFQIHLFDKFWDGAIRHEITKYVLILIVFAVSIFIIIWQWPKYPYYFADNSINYMRLNYHKGEHQITIYYNDKGLHDLEVYNGEDYSIKFLKKDEVKELKSILKQYDYSTDESFYAGENVRSDCPKNFYHFKIDSKNKNYSFDVCESSAPKYMKKNFNDIIDFAKS